MEIKGINVYRKFIFSSVCFVKLLSRVDTGFVFCVFTAVLIYVRLHLACFIITLLRLLICLLFVFFSAYVDIKDLCE